MRQVYTYSDFKSLVEEPYYELIRSSPHIAVSRGLKDGLNNYHYLNLKYKVADFQDAMRIIAGRWNDEYDSVNKTALAGEFFSKLISETNDKNRIKWLRDCRKNSFFLLSSLNLLNEAGVLPEDIKTDNQEILLLKQFYEYVLENDNSIQSLFSVMDQIKEKEKCKSFLTKLFGKCDFDTIVINSVYYITPLQERILLAFEQCGFNLIFLIPYDDRYKYIFQIWDLTYSEDRGYPPYDNWVKSSDHIENSFGEIFNGKKPQVSNVSIHENKSVIDCVEDVRKSRKKGYKIYSTDHSRANEIFHDFLPQEYERRNLLSYPIGKFIQSVHSMWDTDTESIALSEDLISTCFSSGWLSSDGKSSDDYIGEFCALYPFFQDCNSLKDWEIRLDLLSKIRKTVATPFDETYVEGMNRFLSNPLLNFSMFSVEDGRYEIVRSMLNQLFTLLHILFDNQQPITIGQHFEKIEHFIRENCPDKKKSGEELLVYDNIMSRVSFDPESRLYLPKNICPSVLMFLQQGLDSFGEDGSKRKGMVNPFYQLDSARLEQKSKIHIVLGDVKRLPGKERQYVWPLNKDFIYDLYEQSVGEKKYLLSDVIHIMRSFPILNRYMFFSSLFNDDVIVSWVSVMDDKELPPSPYIRLLSDKCGIPIESNSKQHIPYNVIKGIDPSAGQIRSEEINFDGSLIKEARIDYSICPLKYIYGFVLQDHPSFQSNFTINMAVGGLIRALDSTRIEKYDDIAKKVYSLFPFVKKSEQRQIRDFPTPGGNDDYTEYGDYKYSEKRLLIEYPTKEYRETALFNYGMLVTPNGRKGFDIQGLPDIKDICLFCQHSDYCRRSLHMDDELPGESDDE